MHNVTIERPSKTMEVVKYNMEYQAQPKKSLVLILNK